VPPIPGGQKAQWLRRLRKNDAHRRAPRKQTTDGCPMLGLPGPYMGRKRFIFRCFYSARRGACGRKSFCWGFAPSFFGPCRAQHGAPACGWFAWCPFAEAFPQRVYSVTLAVRILRIPGSSVRDGYMLREQKSLLRGPKVILPRSVALGRMRPIEAKFPATAWPGSKMFNPRN